MKFFIALMFVAVVSAGRPARKRDVSEYYGAGWSKSADGYNYPSPADNVNSVDTTYYAPAPAPAPAPVYTAPAPAPVYTAPATTVYTETKYVAPSTTYTTSYEPALETLSDDSYGTDVYTPDTDYLPPVASPSNEYLPPSRRRKLRVQRRKLRVAKRQF